MATFPRSDRAQFKPFRRAPRIRVDLASLEAPGAARDTARSTFDAAVAAHQRHSQEGSLATAAALVAATERARYAVDDSRREATDGFIDDRAERLAAQWAAEGPQWAAVPRDQAIAAINEVLSDPVVSERSLASGEGA